MLLLQHLARHHNALDLVGALVDLGDPRAGGGSAELLLALLGVRHFDVDLEFSGSVSKACFIDVAAYVPARKAALVGKAGSSSGVHQAASGRLAGSWAGSSWALVRSSSSVRSAAVNFQLNGRAVWL